MRRYLILLIAIFALVAAGCGSDSGDDDGKPASVPEGYVAVVGERQISVDQLNHQIELKVNALEANKQKVPKPGTDAYRQQIVQPLVESLVYAAQLRNIADELDIDVTDKEITSALDKDIEQYYGGDRSKYEADLKKFGVSEEDVKEQIGLNLIQTDVQEQLLKEVKVTDKDLRKYYDEHKQDYATQDSRKVQFLLVSGRDNAEEARQELQGGAKWNTVAKKYAIDPGPPSTGGALTAQKGSLEKNFEKAAFELETDELSQPVLVSDEYASSNLAGKCKPSCFFLIRPTQNVVEGEQQEFDAVKEQLRQTLEQTRKNEHLQDRVKKLLDAQKAMTVYAPQYKPAQPQAPGTGGGDTGSTQ